jgi:sec-independent protein translocase protein TatB
VQFLGVGWQEVLLVSILAFFVLGPERMPVVAYQIGKAVRSLQQYARAVRDEFGEEISYVEDQYRTVRGDLDQARTELRQQQRQIESEWRTQTTEIEAGIKDAQTAVEDAGKVVRMADRAPAAAAAANGAAPSPVEPAAGAGAGALAAAEAPAGERRDGPPLVF